MILANPPFMSPTGGIRPHNRFMVKSKRSEVLFVDYMREHLTTNGRAGIIVPRESSSKAKRPTGSCERFWWRTIWWPWCPYQAGFSTPIPV